MGLLPLIFTTILRGEQERGSERLNDWPEVTQDS